MINLMAKALTTPLGPTPAYGFGPGAKAGVESKEGGPGKSHIDKFYPGKEAVSATTQTAQLKDQGKKEAQAPKKKTNYSFREANNEPFKNRKFSVVLIKEGLGNFKNRFFYTKNALQAAAASKLFEGTQSFADHPSQLEEEIRPERSTRDILGYYENVQYKENNGQGFLGADLVVADNISLDWAISLLTNSLEYSKKFKEADLVGLSINASGAASSVDIDEFIKSEKFSDSVLEKLMEAKAQGITEINVVDELKESQSVDLVTKAGAGGRILKMLEQDRRNSMKVKESEAMEKKKETEDGKPAQADGGGDAATPDHADAGQDKALFAQMIKQYLGKDDASPEEMEAAQHTHEACKEMGMEGQEAYEAAGNHLKMAMAVGKKMQSKQDEAAKQAEAEGAKEKEGDEANKEGQAVPTSPTSVPAKKESDTKVIELTAENARLRESNRKFETEKYLEKKMAECGKSNLVTKKFREALGTPKSKEHIDETFKIFMKAYEAKAEEVSCEPMDGFLIEKQTYRESFAETKDVGLGDCLR